MKIVQGDILTFDGDAIVNPANGHLRHGGGLARIIECAAARDFDIGGPYPGGVEKLQRDLARHEGAVEKWHADHRAAPLIPTGGAYVTSAGALPLKGVIHAVGPIWGGGRYCEAALLSTAHRMALWNAWNEGWTRVALPAISCGIFGYPVERAAPIALAAAEFYEKRRGLEVSFYLFEDAHVEAYQRAWARC